MSPDNPGTWHLHPVARMNARAFWPDPDVSAAACGDGSPRQCARAQRTASPRATSSGAGAWRRGR